MVYQSIMIDTIVISVATNNSTAINPIITKWLNVPSVKSRSRFLSLCTPINADMTLLMVLSHLLLIFTPPNIVKFSRR